MAITDPIVVQIDQTALQEQVAEVIKTANRTVSLQLRHAANLLDPDWQEQHDKWLLSGQRPTIMPEVDLNRLAQYLYEEGATKVTTMTAKGDLVNAVSKALNRIGIAIEYDKGES